MNRFHFASLCCLILISMLPAVAIPQSSIPQSPMIESLIEKNQPTKKQAATVLESTSDSTSDSTPDSIRPATLLNRTDYTLVMAELARLESAITNHSHSGVLQARQVDLLRAALTASEQRERTLRESLAKHLSATHGQLEQANRHQQMAQTAIPSTAEPTKSQQPIPVVLRPIIPQQLPDYVPLFQWTLPCGGRAELFRHADGRCCLHETHGRRLITRNVPIASVPGPGASRFVVLANGWGSVYRYPSGKLEIVFQYQADWR